MSQYGVTDKAAALEVFAANRNPFLRTTTEDQRVLELTDDAAIVIGRTTIEAQPEGRDEVVVFSVRTSTVYVRKGDAWRIAFHQQTPA